MKILLFGGSFDPPHIGHQRLLAAAFKSLKPDIAYLIPAYQSPLKRPHQTSPAHRLRMAGLLRDSLPQAARARVRLEPFEIRHRRPSFTFETLRHLRRRHRSAEFYFLLGSDAFARIDRWKRLPELNRDCRWVVGKRPGRPLAPAKNARVLVLSGSFPSISSTGLRCRLLAGENARGLVAPAVFDYIVRHQLYGWKAHKELKRTLSPERYQHTLAVARLALSLAKRHGLDPEKAATAGLLHDAGRRFDPAAMTRYALRRRLRIPAHRTIIENAPMLQHAFVSEDLARRRFGVRDPEILGAIRNHTLGAVAMPKLDRLIYVADSSSEDRAFPAAAKIRRLAGKDLDAAFRQAVGEKLKYVQKNKFWAHPGTRRFAHWAERI